MLKRWRSIRYVIFAISIAILAVGLFSKFLPFITVFTNLSWYPEPSLFMLRYVLSCVPTFIGYGCILFFAMHLRRGLSVSEFPRHRFYCLLDALVHTFYILSSLPAIGLAGAGAGTVLSVVYLLLLVTNLVLIILSAVTSKKVASFVAASEESHNQRINLTQSGETASQSEEQQ